MNNEPKTGTRSTTIRTRTAALFITSIGLSTVALMSFAQQLTISSVQKLPPTANTREIISSAAVWGANAGAGSLAMLPCQQYYETFLASAGIDKDMLGSISGSVPPKTE